jgi:hypothetical protein
MFYRNDLLATTAITTTAFGLTAVVKRMSEARAHNLAA